MPAASGVIAIAEFLDATNAVQGPIVRQDPDGAAGEQRRHTAPRPEVRREPAARCASGGGIRRGSGAPVSSRTISNARICGAFSPPAM